MIPSTSCNHLALIVVSCLVLNFTACADEQVDREKLRVSLTPELTNVMLKVPTSIGFMIYNDATDDLFVRLGGDNRNALGRPDTFRVTVTDADGKPVPQPDSGFDFGGISWMQKVPAQGKHEVQLYLPHWATFSAAGRYSITVQRKLQAIHGPVEGGLSDDQLTAFDVKAEGQIHVTPYDEREMGKLIDKLGEEVFEPNSDVSETALRDLSHIRDARTIPYFIRAIETKRYSVQFGALRALGHYNNEIALAALKRGMQLNADDVEHVSRRKDADQLAINLRHVCAESLRFSPHPGAIAFLLSRRTDPSEAVRITILHALGQMPPAEALPILQEMANDKVERVSTEAKRYITLLKAKP